jgi:hypothetical protein
MKIVCDEVLVESVSAQAFVPIEASGAYVGVLTQAKERTASTGTKGIEFTFRARDGSVARYLTLWIQRANGEKIDYSYGLLSSLLACLGLKEAESKPVESEEWDKTIQARVPMEIQVFEELMDREIGVLLERTETPWEGKTMIRMSLAGFFRPSTKQMAAQILKGEQDPSVLEARINGLRKAISRPFDSLVPSTSAGPAKAKPSFDDLAEDDIPF